jgi:ribosomal protein S18 acetylase RimI-like enzyme
MQITNLREDLIRPLVRLTNKALPYDSVTKWSFMRCTFLDPNFDPSLTFVAMEDDLPVGVALGSMRSKEPKEMISTDHGWIKLFAVDPGRAAEVAPELLSALETEMSKRGVAEVRVSDFAGWHFFPGIQFKYSNLIRFFTDHGYNKVSEAVDYVIDLSEFVESDLIESWRESIRSQGYEVKTPSRDEMESVVSWVMDTFGPAWKHETLQAFRHDPPSVFIAKKGDKIVGFSVYSALELDWFGPIGVAEDERHNKIGTILLYQCLKEMKLEGLKTAVIPWTSHLFFYANVPTIRKIKYYWILSKKITR